jgi:RNA polymerase sigma-70 factor (ECF subfamily)
VKRDVNAAVARVSASAELDELTVARAQRGEAAACRALVERYQRPVFAILSRLCGRGPLVEDLAQETFLRVFRSLPGFVVSGRARLSTWILTIAARLAIDELRRTRHRSVPLAADLPSGANTESGAIGRAIEGAIRSLSPDHRAVFLLREYHGLEYEEIARALDVDVGTVRSRLSRARDALRTALGDEP